MQDTQTEGMHMQVMQTKIVLAAMLTVNMLLALNLALVMPAYSAPSALDQAKASYNSHDYKKAAKQFQQLIKNIPDDEVAHYYLALSYKALANEPEAKSEFEWVLKNGKTKSLQDDARKAIASAANSSLPAHHGNSSKSILPKIMDFSAVWCAPCKRFAPVFDKVAKQYKDKVEFVHYDIDKGEGKVLGNKYKVDSLPTVIFMDSKGKIILKYEGGIMSEQELAKNTEALLK